MRIRHVSRRVFFIFWGPLSTHEGLAFRNLTPCIYIYIYILGWLEVDIFPEPSFFGSFWAPKQLCKIWERLVLTPICALQLKFVWKLLWENLLFCTSNFRIFCFHQIIIKTTWKYSPEYALQLCRRKYTAKMLLWKVTGSLK